MKHALVIYHNQDMDGLCSGAVARMGLEAQGYKVQMRGYDYSEAPFVMPRLNSLHSLDKVYMVDVTMPPEIMAKWNLEYEGDFVLIDHHKARVEEIESHLGNDRKFLIVYDDRNAACELCWEFFSCNNPLSLKEKFPVALRQIANWDLHRNAGTDSFVTTTHLHYVFDAIMHEPTMFSDFQEWVMLLTKASDANIGNLKSRGAAIELHIKKQAKDMSRDAHRKVIGGIMFNMFNGKPNKWVTVENEYPLCFFWYLGKEEKMKYSLRQNEREADSIDYDILSVAQSMGGGGHANACGFHIDMLIPTSK